MNGEANNLMCSPFYYEFKSRQDNRLQMEAFSALATAGFFCGEIAGHWWIPLTKSQ